MISTGFERTNLAIKEPQTNILDRKATGIGLMKAHDLLSGQK
jgi:hypothetical protein